MNRADSGDKACREVLDVIMAHGVETIVLSPGSRNTPLLIGSSARCKLTKHIIDDERTAAFTALGIAIATQKPVALACTSGTALYNYAPAVAEAFYQKIPLIVISADRPYQWIGQDDSQTLLQNGALDGIVKKSFDIPSQEAMSVCAQGEAFETERDWYVNRISNEAMITATSGIKGPVHINMQFSSPFNTTVPYVERDIRVIEYFPNDNSLPIHKAREISEYLLDRKVLVVAGFMPSDHKLNKAIAEFSKLGNVSVISEPISNLHVDNPGFRADVALSRMDDETKKSLEPDVIISIGGALVSTSVKAFLRNSINAEHWTLKDTDVATDCFMKLTKHFDITPFRFMSNIASMSRHIMKKGKHPSHPDYNNRWRTLLSECRNENKSRLLKTGWSELKAFESIIRKLPDDCNLFLSNGTCVRYGSMLIDRMPHACWSNRGVSGIDGTNATAFGASLGYKGMTILITGDMSFAYCPEVLNMRRMGGDLRIIVMNNRGGGIFRVVKTTRDLDSREEYFCSDPQLPIEKLCNAYGWNYHMADSVETLQEAMDYLKGHKATLVEVCVDPEHSASAMIEFMKAMP